MAKVRINIEVNQEFANLLENLAEHEDTTKAEIVRRALSIMKAYSEQMERGRTHIGFVADPGRLDAEMLGILSSPANVRAGDARRAS